MKLPLREGEHEALRAALGQWDGFVASALIAVEAVRACARYGAEYAKAARDGLSTLALMPVDEAVLATASALEPWELRSLDALHLATALSLGDDLGVLFSYDERLSSAAAARGVAVESPG